MRANQQVRITNCKLKTNPGDLNTLDSGDPMQHSCILPSTQPSRILPLTLKREQGWHQDTTNQRRRVDSTTAGRSLDNRAHLEVHSRLINLASDYPTGDSAANEIKDARAENRGSEAGLSEEGEGKDKGTLKERNFLEEMKLRKSEYHRVRCDASYLRNLTANLPPDRDGAEEGRADQGLGRKGRGGRHRGRRGRGGRSRANQSWNAK